MLSRRVVSTVFNLDLVSKMNSQYAFLCFESYNEVKPLM